MINKIIFIVLFISFSLAHLFLSSSSVSVMMLSRDLASVLAPSSVLEVALQVAYTKEASMRLLIVYLFYYFIKYLIIYYKIILVQLSGYKFICAVIYVNIRDCVVTWYDTFLSAC